MANTIRTGMAAALVIAAAMSAQSAENERRTPLTRVIDIRTLPPEVAKRSLPVKLHAVITYVDPTNGTGQLFVQDETAGVFIFLKDAVVSEPLRAGQSVEVEAVTVAGDFSPCLAKPRIHVLGPGRAPSPKRPVYDQFLATREDGQWTELTGVVRSGEIKNGRLFLNVAVTGGSFLAITPDYRSDWEKTLVDSVVSVTGAMAPIRNQFRQAVGVRLFVPGQHSIRIEQPAPKDPFRLPLSEGSAVGGFHPGEDFIRRIRVRAAVTAADSGTLYVSSGPVNLAIQGECNLVPGEYGEIAGFPGVISGRPGLLEALCRKLPAGTAAVVAAAGPDEIMPEGNFSDASGVGQAAGTRFDMKLVRMEGTLLQISRGAVSQVLILESGNRQFVAVLPGASLTRTRLPDAGDRIQLTGVCLITYDPYHRGQSFRIIVRSSADIAIVARSPWWNPQRALWGIGFMSAIVLLAAAWIALLRHRVESSTRELRRANEQLQRISCEDPLTGAGNRRQFDLSLQSELERARRHSLTMSLLLVDIDFFKALNDSCGHLHGDQCLARVAGALQSALRRSTDRVARFGGEEFAVVLPETDGVGALVVAERMREAVRDLAISHPGIERPFLSISVGVATFREFGSGDEHSPESVIRLADEALYQAKLRGRDRCVPLEQERVTRGAQNAVPVIS